MEVTGNAVMVDTHENSISTVIDNNRIMELPLDGRNAPALILLSGGAANVALSSNDLNSSKNYGNGNSANSSPTVTISVGGSQENANNYLLDGSDNNDAFSNVNAPFPFPDAIQEFSVQSSGLSARYGVHAGAVVNVVTKSGTNSFHGDVFEFSPPRSPAPSTSRARNLHGSSAPTGLRPRKPQHISINVTTEGAQCPTKENQMAGHHQAR